jgi:prephenate dehydrogenase
MYVLVRAKDTTTTLSIDFSDLWKATKVGAIVGGQTSCKAPELAAFEKHLPPDVEILSCHSLHGPQVNPKGQPLV